MKVLIVEPGKYPREADIEHTLEAEQAVVGGTIETMRDWSFWAMPCLRLFPVNFCTKNTRISRKEN